MLQEIQVRGGLKMIPFIRGVEGGFFSGINPLHRLRDHFVNL